MKFGFGDHTLDEERHELRRRDEVIVLQRKPLALLIHLVRHRDRVVDKQELLDAIWPRESVTDASLARAVSVLRRAIGDSARVPAVLVTVARRGYRFAAPVDVLSPEPLTPGADGRYVGRAEMLDGLRSSLEQALTGRGRILLLLGEPGVGKTRTAELLGQWARGARAEVSAAWGSDPGSPTYWPWTRILRGLARAHPRALSLLSAAQRRQLARILPEAATGAATGPMLDGEVARFRLFEAVQTFLGRIVQERPTALIFDDVHAADAESLNLLEFVGQALSDWPIVFVLMHRHSHPMRSAPQGRALERLLRLSSVERWPITGLHGEDLSELARLILGRRPDASLQSALERQTGGNPLLLRESLRSMQARGMFEIERSRSEWETLLPRSIEYLIDAKLRPLSDEARSLLSIASAIGLDVESRVLASCRTDTSPIDIPLDELSEAGILMPRVGSGSLRFSHVLIRNAVYDALVPPGATRREVHARIATALTLPSLAVDTSVSERAFHACEAAPLFDPRQSAGLAQTAAEAAAALHDFEGAASWYERALASAGLAQSPDRALNATLCLGLGLAQIATSGLERARETLRRSSEEARAADCADVLARAALAYADRPNSTGHPDPEVILLLSEASGRLPTQARALRICVDSRLAAEHRYSDRTSADRLCGRAMADARALGDPAVLARVLDDASFVLWSTADPKAWIELNAEAARVARLAGDERIELSGTKGCVTGYLELCDLAGVDRAIRDCARAAELLRTPNARWWMTILEASQDLIAGELDPAERRIVSSIALGEQASAPDVALELPAQFVYLRLEQGRSQEIEPATREQTRRFPEQPAWRAAHARVLVACGRTLEARELLASLAARDFLDVPRDRVWIGTHALAVEVAHACGDVGVARSLERVLTPYAELGVLLSSVLFYGPVSHYLGLAAETQSDWDRAISWYEAALDREMRFGAHLFAARTRVALARTLRARNSAGDRPRSITLIGESLETADRKGLADIADSARRLESELWKRTANDRSDRKSLTARKRDIDR